MCFSKYKQTCVFQYGSVFQHTQITTLSDVSQNLISLSVQQLHRQGIEFTNRPYLESAFFEMCIISIFILVSFERK